jgi:hypothetical protein
MCVRAPANDGEKNLVTEKYTMRNQGVRKRWRKLLVTEKVHALEADCRLATVLHGSYMRTQGLKMIARVRAIT